MALFPCSKRRVRDGTPMTKLFRIDVGSILHANLSDGFREQSRRTWINPLCSAILIPKPSCAF